MVNVEGDRKPVPQGSYTLQAVSSALSACFLGGGGPHVGEATRLGGITRPSIYSPILI